VTDAASGKALAKVYVKSYVRTADGEVKFYKDGYTDLRGRFDYCVGEHAGAGGRRRGSRS